MSADKTRIGAPTTATTVTAGTPGTSAEVREFSREARPVYVTNTSTTEDLFLKVNLANASASDFLVKLGPEQAVELSSRGIVNVKSVSLWYASVAFSNAKVVGWLP